jgi:hypothetical protein
MQEVPFARSLRPYLPAALATLLAPVTRVASAQPVDQLKDDGSGWIAYLIAAVLVIAIAVGSFMAAKRGHQD